MGVKDFLFVDLGDLTNWVAIAVTVLLLYVAYAQFK